MASYTNEKYADILMVYGSANGVARETRRIYQGLYPSRRNVFSNTYRRLRETGNLNQYVSGIKNRQYNVTVDEHILSAFDDDPTTSIRKVAETLRLSILKVWSVLRRAGKNAFHYTPVQG